MFEKEAEEYAKQNNPAEYGVRATHFTVLNSFKDGAEFGYNKALEEVKHGLMMKLKDEGIVKPLKDSISHNERLSSQEQQELYEWIESAMGFGEKLDECAEKLTEAKEIIKDYMIIVKGGHITVCSVPEENRCINVLKLNEQAEQFLKEVAE